MDEGVIVMAIRNKNLNLIPILQALLREESVVRAADICGLSQPAMSSALARLRDVLGDPLLVRVGRSMRLTPRALHLRENIDEICALIDHLFQPESFDPVSAKLNFRVAAPDYLAYLITRHLLPRLSKEAPGIYIQFVDVPGDAPVWMAKGTMDLAVCGEFGFWPELQREFLFRERYVATLAKDHPLAARPSVESEELLKYPSSSLIFDPELLHGPREKHWVTGIKNIDYVSQISAMGQFNSVLIAAEAPFVCRAPASLVRQLSQFMPIKAIEISDEVAEFDTCMFWTRITDQAIEHKWLRRVIKACVEKAVKGLPKPRK